MAGDTAIYSMFGEHVTTLNGVGPALARRLARRGAATLGDLLLHFPRRYLDDRTIVPIARLTPGEPARIAGRILTREARGVGRAQRVHLTLQDATGVLSLIFFHSGYMMRDARLAPGQSICVRGTPEIWQGRLQMTHPEWMPAARFRPGVVPVYPQLAGIRSERLRGFIDQALRRIAGLASPLDALPGIGMPLARALQRVHAPESPDEEGIRAALERIRCEELIVYLSMLRERRQQAECAGPVLADDRLDSVLAEALPYPLTSAQAAAWGEIAADLASGRRMHRLLQGDVGAGKTWVAALAIARAVGSGGQAALMAPTEVLAAQHHQTLADLLEPLGIRVARLTGGTRSADRRRIVEALASGDCRAVVGTHALLSDDVRFKRLVLALVDEQHRFGVRQRWALADKGGETEAVHVLAMTATPIPRTLALALYGDMDLSVMRGMPPGRKPVETRVLPSGRMGALKAGIRRLLDGGGRIYWIVPRVDEDEDGASVRQRAEALARHFPDAGVSALHGRMKPKEKERVLRDFAEGRCRMLVSTTVVEVGVNVPEARLIVIEQAESYGLAQLHQLRGRVGRSEAQGYCMLIAGENASEQALNRLKLMETCHDGLELAEADMRLRGAGDALGTRQSGDAAFRVVDPVRDAPLIRRWHRELPDLGLPDAVAGFWRPDEAGGVD